MSEKVNHPSHYNVEGRKECIDEMCDLFGVNNTAIFCLLNAYKYMYRAGNKEENNYCTDIAKADWYINWVREHIEDFSLESIREIVDKCRKHID